MLVMMIVWTICIKFISMLLPEFYKLNEVESHFYLSDFF